MRQTLRARHYSPRTEKSYVWWIRRFLAFHGMRPPRDMGAAEITSFLSSLATRGQVSAATQNQAFSALLFLFREVLGREVLGLEQVVRAKRPPRIPLVLTPAEVAAILGQLEGTLWLMASLMYGAGLRLLECCHLRVKDIDFARREIIVRDGKGRKDRVTPLPERLSEALRAHLERVGRQHNAELDAGLGGSSCPTRSPASTPPPRATGRGNGCSRVRASTRCRAPANGDGTTSTSRSSNRPSHRETGVRRQRSRATRIGPRAPLVGRPGASARMKCGAGSPRRSRAGAQKPQATGDAMRPLYGQSDEPTSLARPPPPPSRSGAAT